MPLAAGSAALIIAGVGAITVGSATGAGSGDGKEYPTVDGQYVSAADGGARDPNVDAFSLSRDADRELLEEQASEQADQRRAALRALAARTEKRAKHLQDTQWVIPVAGYRITAQFGDSGSYWSSDHTGLDFATETGVEIVSVAHGTVTETGYDGSYGNKTVVELDDGTEIWYCHQNAISVSEGQTVDPGESIGEVGATGNVTGPHLHLEVHPEGGDPVDPYTALEEHGVTP